MRRIAPVLLGLALLIVGADTAAAADVDDAGWWWRLQTVDPLPVPAPPNVPPGGLLVQGAPDGAVALGAVRFMLGEGETEPTLVLRVTEDGSQGGSDAVILACPTDDTWTGGDAQPWEEHPQPDCDRGAVAGDVADDETTVTFALASLVDGSEIDVVLVPGTTDGEPLDGSNGSTFSLTFEPPESSDLRVATAGVTSPTTQPATSSESGPVPGSSDRQFGANDTSPATSPAPTFATSPPEVDDADPAPVGEDDTSTDPAVDVGSAPVLDGVAALPEVPRDPLSAGDLVPLAAVLGFGPLLWVAARRGWLAPALAGVGLATTPAAAPATVAAGRRDTAATSAPMLSCRGVSVNFGGMRALKEVDLDVFEGEIVGLIGPNGAGKTTLMECISGFQPVAAGTVTYLGQDLLASGPGSRAGLGIGRTLQNVRLFPYLTVLDNVRVALHRHATANTGAHSFSLPSARDEESTLLAEAQRILDLIGMDDTWAEKYASELSYGTLRLLELACMLALEPRLLLLDEPASGISQKETEALGPLLRDIQEATGATILIIEHDMPLVMSLCDRIYCLEAGANLSTGTPEEIQSDPAVAEAYLGTPAEQQKVAVAPSRPEDVGAEMLLEMSGIDVFYDKVQVLHDVDFHVRRGERVALLGTNGAGKSTILKAASRLIPIAAGTITWKGEDITATPAERLVRMGLGQVPGGRGLFPTLSVGENLRMGGYIYPDEREVDREVERVTHYFPWIAERANQAAGTLSGGEQQQLATARALMARPELLMIDELSLGLAPMVIENLMDTMQRLCDEEGLTVVVVEQQASFALGYTDRAYFMEKGEVRYDGPSADLTGREDLLRSVFLSGASAGFAAAGAEA